MGGNSAFKIRKLIAVDEANTLERRKLALGLSGLAQCQVEFTEMLVRAAMAAIERQRPLIVLHCRPPLAQAVIGISDVILDVGVARVAQGCELERVDRGLPIARAKAEIEAMKALRAALERVNDSYWADRTWSTRSLISRAASAWRAPEMSPAKSRCSRCPHARRRAPEATAATEEWPICTTMASRVPGGPTTRPPLHQVHRMIDSE